MSEAQQPTTNGQADGQEQGPKLAIQKIYLKDLSFEAPNTPAVFQEDWDPKIELELYTNTEQLDEDNHEVVVRVVATVKQQDKVAFLAEAQQAGIFSIQNFTDDQKKQMLGSYCPSIIFPYVREVISDASVRGGFPQLALAPVNFDLLYAQHLQQEQANAAASEQPTQ